MLINTGLRVSETTHKDKEILGVLLYYSMTREITEKNVLGGVY